MRIVKYYACQWSAIHSLIEDVPVRGQIRKSEPASRHSIRINSQSSGITNNSSSVSIIVFDNNLIIDLRAIPEPFY